MKTLLLSLLILFAFTSSIDPVDQTAFYKGFTTDGTIDYGIESGWVTVDGIDPHATKIEVNRFFYQLIYKKGTSKTSVLPTDPVVIWLNGGPGCSSQIGLYTEVGPFGVKMNTEKKVYELTPNAQSWNKLANLLVIDQPFGAGLSWSNSTNYIADTDIAAKYFGEFIYTFLNAHTELKANPFYIFGESYAGHYIPAFATIVTTDENLKFINYQGIGIGDGWTNPLYQVSSYASYLYSAGLVDGKGRQFTQQISNEAQQDLLNGEYKEGSEKFDEASGGDFMVKTISISPYNFWQYVDPKAKQPAPEDYANFLNSNADKFVIPSFIKYQDCNDTIYSHFTEDIGKSRAEQVVALLDKGKVMLYNGQLDYIVNTPGAISWINDMNWIKLGKWKSTEKQILKSGEKVIGTYKSFDNLNFVTIYQAGHMVPTDQPESAYIMFNNYISDKWN